MLTLTFKRPTNSVILPLLSAIALLATLGPTIWHAKHRNIPALSLIAWLGVINACSFINPLIWPTDDVFHWWSGYGLCDVETRLLLMAGAGIAGSLAAIIRNLAIVMDIENAVIAPTRAQRRRTKCIDLAICHTAPLFIAATSWIVQSPRYAILTTAGCSPLVDSSWPSIVLCYIWSPLLALVASIYSVLVVWRIVKYRQQFRAILSRNSSGLNQSRFYRLLVLALILVLVHLPITLYTLYVNSLYLFPFDYSEIHGPGWNQILRVPTGGFVSFDKWVSIASGLLIFLFFGLGKDAKGMYADWATKLGIKRFVPSFGRSIRLNHSSLGTQTSLASQARLWYGRRAKTVLHGSVSSLKDRKSFMSNNSSSFGSYTPSIPMNLETRVWSTQPAIKALCSPESDAEDGKIEVRREVEQSSEIR